MHVPLVFRFGAEQLTAYILAERSGPFHDQPVVSFRAPPADQMSIAALEGELEFLEMRTWLLFLLLGELHCPSLIKS